MFILKIRRSDTGITALVHSPISEGDAVASYVSNRAWDGKRDCWADHMSDKAWIVRDDGGEFITYLTRVAIYESVRAFEVEVGDTLATGERVVSVDHVPGGYVWLDVEGRSTRYRSTDAVLVETGRTIPLGEMIEQ